MLPAGELEIHVTVPSLMGIEGLMHTVQGIVLGADGLVLHQPVEPAARRAGAVTGVGLTPSR